MGWGFHVTCPDCRHEWEGTETSVRLGWSHWESSYSRDVFREWFCPRCYRRLYVIRRVDRNSWRKWRAKLLADGGPGFPYLDELAAKVDACLPGGRPYTPVAVDLEPGDCPGCLQPFEEEVGESAHLVCPKCTSRAAVLQGFDCHCSTIWDEYGFH